MLRRQTNGGVATINPRKMFDESQMVRRVRAYLASIKSSIITDEAHLSEMSARCEPPAQHPPQQPGMFIQLTESVVTLADSLVRWHYKVWVGLSASSSRWLARVVLCEELLNGLLARTASRCWRPYILLLWFFLSFFFRFWRLISEVTERI